MTYTVRHDDTTGSDYVRDGGVYIGDVTHETAGYRAARNLNPASEHKTLATFQERDDAIEWLVCEHRDIPWSDRPEAQRVEAA